MSRLIRLDEALALETAREYGTEKQLEALDALLEHRNFKDAARSIGLSRSAFKDRLTCMGKKAAAGGHAPVSNMVRERTPPGFVVKGTSTLYGAEGDTKIQWIKTERAKEEMLADLVTAMKGAFEDYDGKAPRIPGPRRSYEDLLAVITQGDPHYGMHAWGALSGEDFDLDKAVSVMRGCVDELVEYAPPAKTCIVANMGDLMHADNKAGTTTRGTPVDTDTRWAKVYKATIMSQIWCVQRALEKFEHVHVKNLIGNHDGHVAVTMSVGMKLYFSYNPRVTVDETPGLYNYYRHGRCLLGFHHGHGAKPTNLDGIMSVDRAKDGGETRWRHWYTGHVHHDQVKDLYGCKFESVRTTAPQDGWHHGEGYRSDRDMKMDFWHTHAGRRARFWAKPELLKNGE